VRDDEELKLTTRHFALAGVWLAVMTAGPGSLLRTKAPEGWGVPAGARAVVRVGSGLSEESTVALRAAMERLQRFGVKGMTAAEEDRDGAGVRAVVVDGAGVIRYEGRWPVTVAGMRAMGEGVLEWDRGRRAFAGSCGLCHGEDGTSEASAEAKSLAGVSTRMSDAEIVEHAERVGAVMVSTWPKAEAAALLTFIRGL
jgi:mono/diheme cytochrome c family protein